MAVDRTPILYVAPWVGEGAPDLGTIEWFKSLDRERWAPSLVSTQPSPNRQLLQIEPYAEEVWDLPDLMPGEAFPEFILGFIESREVRLVHIMDSRLCFDLLPDIACLPRPPAVVAQMHDLEPGQTGYTQYVSRRYGNLVDAFSVTSEDLKGTVAGHEIPPSRIEVIGAGEETGARHGELYERLLAARPASSRWRADDLLGGDRIEFDTGDDVALPVLRLPRTPPPERTVGIIVPCYRHGLFLDECIASIKAQTLAPARIVVVDDGSDDPETIEAIARLDGDPEVEVIRQETNRGPSAARNRALEVLDTSYVLPIDADDKLLPDALERMLAQLEAAPENVGFVYPHAQHFGNRSDYVQLPAYNLWLLMKENYCPAPALFDRRLFEEGGVGYPEEILVGHEDWDLVLQLGERDVRGIHASGPTFLYRRQGFSRVNAVDYGPQGFHRAIERRHSGLYRNSDRIKTEWAPAVSVVLLDENGVWEEADLEGLSQQSCPDFEVLARTGLAQGVRSVGSVASTPAAWLQEAMSAARGRWACILTPAAHKVLHDRSFVEHLIYGFVTRKESYALALGVAPQLARYSLSQLDDADRQLAEPVGIAFERRAANQLPEIELHADNPILADFVLALQIDGLVQWRLAPPAERPATAPEADTAGPAKRPHSLQINLDRAMDKSEFATRDLIAHEPPRLPELTPGTARRWEETSGWTPPGTRQLCRHISADGEHRIIANHRYSPPGYSLEFDLGAVHLNASPGMRRLVHADHSFELIDDQNSLGENRHALGYVDQQPLPQLERLELRQMPDGGEKILVAGERDPLFEIAEPLADFGWIEAFPLNPRNQLTNTGPWRAVALRRYSEENGLRHRYGTGAGERPGAVELGSLYPLPGEGLVALRLRADGRLASELARPGRASRDPRRFAPWIAATPAGSEGNPATRETRARLLYLATSARERRLSEDEGVALGGLRRQGGPNLYPLFSTTHPVTGDQLVTCSPRDAIARGYLQDGVLGYIHLPWDRPVDLR